MILFSSAGFAVLETLSEITQRLEHSSQPGEIVSLGFGFPPTIRVSRAGEEAEEEASASKEALGHTVLFRHPRTPFVMWTLHTPPIGPLQSVEGWY